MKKLFAMLLLVIFFAWNLTGCAASGAISPENNTQSLDISPDEAQLADENAEPLPAPEQTIMPFSGVNLDGLSGYAAHFTINFRGQSEWLYEVSLRKGGAQMEYDLHIDGVKASKNPGDVRVVEGNEMSWMIGPATEGKCVQYSNDLKDVEIEFFLPEHLTPAPDWMPVLVFKGIEEIGAFRALHYTIEQTAAGQTLPGNWKDAQLSLWVEESSGALLKYTFSAQGSDPLFETGDGRIEAYYELLNMDEQMIEPVAGCEIDLPVVADAHKIMRLPGLLVYESEKTKEEASKYYQDELKAQGWQALDYPRSTDEAIVLSYRRNGEAIEINIEQVDMGIRVQIMLPEESN